MRSPILLPTLTFGRRSVRLHMESKPPVLGGGRCLDTKNESSAKCRSKTSRTHWVSQRKRHETPAKASIEANGLVESGGPVTKEAEGNAEKCPKFEETGRTHELYLNSMAAPALADRPS
jgi:hypothetical protein